MEKQIPKMLYQSTKELETLFLKSIVIKDSKDYIKDFGYHFLVMLRHQLYSFLCIFLIEVIKYLDMKEESLCSNKKVLKK